jgi:CRP-like cAMP-binding protein
VNPRARPELQRLVRKLQSITDFSPDEERALLHLPIAVKVVEADTDIVRERERPSTCCLLLEGFICRHKELPDGRRQILSFHTAGDIPDLQSLHLKVLDHNVTTMVRSRVGFIQHQHLLEVCEAYPRIAGALWRDTLIDAAIFREWMVGLGRRTARQRVAHVLCEMAERSNAVGLSSDHSYPLPVTQAELGDALGLSTVHVNRVLQELRAAELVEIRASTVTVRDWQALQQAGEFDPLYLHLEQHGDS